MAELFEPTLWHKDEALGHFFATLHQQEEDEGKDRG